MTQADTALPSPTPSKPKKPKKKGRWRRRFLWTLGALIILGLILRSTLPLALPAVMRKVAGTVGLTCTYQRLELDLVSGDAGIWGLEFKSKDGGDTILTADYCHGNVSVTDLFRGKLSVWRVEADGVEVNIDRNPDGHIPLLDRFIAATGAKTAAAPPPSKAGSDSAAPAGAKSAASVDLSSPLRIDALRLTHIHVHLRDRAVRPQLDTDLAMDLRLSNLGSHTEPAKFEMNLSADPLLDSMKVTGQGQSGGKNLDASFKMIVRGIRLKPASMYLAPLGINPVSQGITLRAEGKIHTAAPPGGGEGFTGSVALDHLSATADLDESMALDHLSIDAGLIDTKSVHLNSIVIDGARATAARGPTGNVRVAGIEYDPKLAAPPEAKPVTNTPSEKPPLLTALWAERVTLDKFSLKNARLDLLDQAVSPPVTIALVADSLTADSIDHDPANPDTAVTLAGTLHSPGLVRDIRIDGSAVPFAAKKRLSIAVTAAGIKPDAVAPYLNAVGVESTLKDGQFSAAADISLSLGTKVRADLAVHKFDLRDGSPLLAMSAVDVTDAELEPGTGRISVAGIELAGPQVSVLRDRDGQLGALGFRTRPVAARLTSSAATATAAAPAGATPAVAKSTTLASLPKISIGRFHWKDVALNLEDRSAVPPMTVAISNIEVDATDLSTDLTKKTPGHFKATVAAPAVVKRLEVTGDLTPRADGLKLTAAVDGSGINATSFAPYLRTFRIEPVLRDGGLKLGATADVTRNDHGLTAAMEIDHLKYTDGNEELAGVDAVRIAGVSLRDGVLSVDEIAITKPRAIARRDADGTPEACGIRLLPPQPVAAVKTTAHVKPAAAEPAITPGPGPAVPSDPVAAKPPAAPFVTAVKKLTVADAGIHWIDSAVRPPVDTTAGATLELDHVTLGREAAPATLNLTAYATGSADRISVTGQVSAGPAKKSAKLEITATGLRAGPLAGYLPSGIESTLKDGRFHTTIDAELSENSAGGLGARLFAGPLDFRDGPAEPPLARLDSVRVDVPRIDLPENGLAVKELSVAGVTAHAEKTADGKIACLGLLIGGKTETAPAPAAAAPVAAAPVAPAVPAPVPAPGEIPASAPVDAGPSVKELVAASHKILPTITVDTLDLNVRQLTVTDLSRPESAPLVVGDLRLHNVNRIDWLGKTAEIKPATELRFECGLSPLVDHVAVDLKLTPFARQPRAAVELTATGVHGDGLTALMPELKPQLDGSDMKAGSVSGKVFVEAKFERRNALDFDLSRGFDLTFVLSKLEYRADPGGPVIGGVDEVRAENIRVAPADSVVRFKTLEITRPIGLITQDDRGIHALGWTYKLPATHPEPVAAAPAGSPPAAAPPATATPATATPAAPGAPPSAAAAGPKGEIRIDKLSIDGLDFRVVDNSVSPPMVIPLNGLDVEVRNISTRSPYEDQPIRFSAIVNADKVKLRKKDGAAGELEDRDLFSQITANGEVSLYPQLHGWAKTSVNGLELADLEGEAKKYGEDLRGGLYDSEVDLRFDPTGAIAISSKFTLTDLSLAEPPNGFVAKSLNLPAPLDVAIGAVEDADGSISLPLNFTIRPKDPDDPKFKSRIPYDEVGLAAAGTVSQVIVTAITAAPLKAAADVANLLGLGGGPKPPEDLTTRIVFSPGSAATGADQTAALAPLLNKLRDDPQLTVTFRHTLGQGDVRLAAVRANPTKEECDGLESQLRSRKAELLKLRADAAGTARANLASMGSAAAEPALRHLRSIDRELTATEESLDEIGELLKPGAERLANRRTKTASLRIASERLKGIKAAITAAGIAPDRIKVMSAQYNPADGSEGGVVVITAVRKK